MCRVFSGQPQLVSALKNDALSVWHCHNKPQISTKKSTHSIFKCTAQPRSQKAGSRRSDELHGCWMGTSQKIRFWTWISLEEMEICPLTHRPRLEVITTSHGSEFCSAKIYRICFIQKNIISDGIMQMVLDGPSSCLTYLGFRNAHPSCTSQGSGGGSFV